MDFSPSKPNLTKIAKKVYVEDVSIFVDILLLRREDFFFAFSPESKRAHDDHDSQLHSREDDC